MREISTRFLIIVSSKDIAGMNMKKRLTQLRDYTTEDFEAPSSWPKGSYEYLRSDHVGLLTIPIEQIYTNFLETGVESEFIIFASKHSSAAGKKSLLVHTTGNWNTAETYGGNDRELAYAPSHVLSYAYELINSKIAEHNLDNYWTGIECTHHGPTGLSAPILFAEAGGTITEWEDQDACDLIAEVIDQIISDFDALNRNRQVFIGVGGNHYCSSFIKLLQEEDLSFGHIIPKYAHKELPEIMLKLAYERTKGEDKIFAIDKKGIRAGDRDRFISYIEQNDWDWRYA